MDGPIQNPIAHLDKLGPTPTPISREQRALARRVAKFEAQRAKEDAMAIPSGMVMQDMNPGQAHQKKMTFKPVDQAELAAVKANKAVAKFEAQRAQFTPSTVNRATVQRVQRSMEQPSEAADIFSELETELTASAAAPAGTESPATEGEASPDVESILKRFKGSPDEVAKQVAKSYAEAEKRMRKLEHERQLLLQQGITPHAAQPAAPAVPQQIQVTPTFDYKKWGDSLLDKPDERAKELESHITSVLDKRVAEIAGPLYEEAIDNRLFRKFGEVVNEDNLDIIKAMAQNEPGANRWEKTVSAVKKYQAGMPTMTPKPNPDVQAMQAAAETPSPQARTTTEKKMWRESDVQSMIQKKIRLGEWQRDPKWRTLIDAAYREGRVLRGQ